jgi:predicted transcriptional regulator
MSNALISIRPKFVRMILCGEKSIEIRNRPVNLQPGTRLWIYSTLPKGCLEAVACVQLIQFDTPEKIWKHHQNEIGISRREFISYVNGSRKITAIFLQGASRLIPSITLSDLRSEIIGFHPPQFFKRIKTSSPFFDLIKDRKVKLTDSSSLGVTTGKTNRREGNI